MNNSYVKKMIIFLSSGFGIGYLKFIPGTLSSFLGIILWELFIPDNYLIQIIYLIVLTIISILLSSLAEQIYKKKDDNRIVIDEILGMCFTLVFLPKTLFFIILGFILFRIFDIKKISFIYDIQKFRNGIGIILDDVLAGMLANTILHIIWMVI
ncbi:MAG: phosphatidylglycerophosphatase A [Endomicrobium sp.]|jgi:phosphatidylglycerophosphatase A|nr:phosphatidylglycerophosphatase A [Endomicrobium sp.]